MISLRNSNILMEVDPDRGGGILRFNWQNLPIFLPVRANDPTPLGLGSFPMVPFSNRITQGRFSIGGIDVHLPPNLPQASEQHVIHGHGWMAEWDTGHTDQNRLHMSYIHKADRWPWHYRCDQQIQLQENGYRHSLSITNQSEAPMPAGLGLHPYFPLDGASIKTKFKGFWNVNNDGLPTKWQKEPGRFMFDPKRTTDTVFTDRIDDLIIDWPHHRLTISPSEDMPHAHIFAPLGQNYFCLEPISHMTDAINRDGLKMLSPQEVWTARVRYSVEART